MRYAVLSMLLLLASGVFGQVPTDGLCLWLRADKGVRSNGNELLVWEDQSGKGNHAVKATASGPLVFPRAIGGRAAVRFDGIDNGMQTPVLSSFTGKRGTFLALVRILGRSRTSGVGMGTIASTYHGNGTVWQFGSNGKGFNYFDGVGGESLPLQEGDMNKWMLVTLRRTRDTVLELFTEGRLDMRIPIHDNQPSPNTLKIGYNGRGGGMAGDSIPEVLNGDIAEIMLYDRALSDEELDGLHKRLSREYGFSLRPKPFRETPWFYVMLLLLFVSTAVALWKILDQRKLKRRMALLQRQHEMDLERQRISREMHDDIGAGLTQIILMSESARRKIGGDSEKEIEDIADTSRRLVGSMNEIIWSLNPENKTLAQLFSYLREQLHRQLEYARMDYSIEFPEGGEGVVLRNEQRRNLLLVTREIVNNAIKYSGARRLWIQAERNDQGIVFEIGDDGRGLDPAAMRSGNGLKNIRHRIEELNGTLELYTAPEKGCRYRFWIPF